MKCFVCNEKRQRLCPIKDDLTMHQCLECGAMWQVPLLQEEDYKDIYNEAYYRDIWGYNKLTDKSVERSKFVMSKKSIKLLKKRKKSGKVLDIGAGLGYLLSFLQKEGFDVYGTEISSFARKVATDRIGDERIYASLDEVKKKEIQFDIIILFDSMEHIPNQQKLLENINTLLAPKGIVFVLMPDCSSWTKKIMGNHWVEYKKDHVLFYTKNALKRQLEQHNFKIIHLSTPWKTVTIYYLISYLSVFRIPLISSFLSAIKGLLPQIILDIPIAFPLGHMDVVFERK